MNLPIQLVIPAAGAGSRFKDAGIDTPKPMIPIGGIPMILWVIHNFNLRPDDSVFIICQRDNAMPRNLEPYLAKFSFKVNFVEIDGLTTGPATTVGLVLPDLNPEYPVIVANSDQFVSHDISKFVTSVRDLEHSGMILTMRATGNKWSYIGRNEIGDIVEVVEKREISDEATVGVYAWSSPDLVQKSIDYLKSEKILINNEYYIAPSYGYFVKNLLSIGVYSVGDHGGAVHGLGTPEDLSDFLIHDNFNQFVNSVNSQLNPS
jgi:NDP-sugar pyrophosphorylase family protein